MTYGVVGSLATVEKDPKQATKVNNEQVLALAEVAAGGKNRLGGESLMPEQYFDKYVQQKFDNIDEKFSVLKNENSLLREDFRNTREEFRNITEQFIAEMRDRDNQRHKELMAIENEQKAIMRKTYDKIDEIKSELNEVNDGMKSEMSELKTEFITAFGDIKSSFVPGVQRSMTILLITTILAIAAIVISVLFGRPY
jgi:hypothetical protein